MRRLHPFWPNAHRMLAMCALLLVFAAVQRWAFLPVRTPDMAEYLVPWLTAAENAGGGYLRHAFTNYTAFYEHCLALIALFPGPPILRIKLLSILFDGVLATVVALLVPRCWRLLAVAVTLALPTVAMNSALLAQSDVIYAVMVAACVFGAVRQRPVWTMLAFSAALAVKLQALLIAPFLLLLWLDRRQPLWTFVLIPVAYLVFALPMAIAGRPLAEIFGVYTQQFGFFHVLSNNAPNLWQIGQALMPYHTGLMLGVLFALAMVGTVAVLLWRAHTLRTPDGRLLAAVILMILAAYCMPKMHDRYFYAVDPLMVALACRDRRFVMPMLLVQAASILAYTPFIADGYILHDPLWGRTGAIARTIGRDYSVLPLLGSVLMGAALVRLLGEACRRAAWRSPAAMPWFTRIRSPRTAPAGHAPRSPATLPTSRACPG